MNATNYNPELLAKIPDTHEVFVYAGTPPESVEGWLRVNLERYSDDSPCVSGPLADVAPRGIDGRNCWLAASRWGCREGDEYGQTWCLARPKQQTEASYSIDGWLALPSGEWECGVCGTRMAVHRTAKHREVCVLEPWVDPNVELPDEYEWAKRGVPLGEGAMYASTGNDWAPVTRTIKTPEDWCDAGVRLLAVRKAPALAIPAGCEMVPADSDEPCAGLLIFAPGQRDHMQDVDPASTLTVREFLRQAVENNASWVRGYGKTWCYVRKVEQRAAECAPKPTRKPKIRCSTCDGEVRMGLDSRPIEPHYCPSGSVTDQPHVPREQRRAAAIEKRCGVCHRGMVLGCRCEFRPGSARYDGWDAERDNPTTIHRMRERRAEGCDLDAKPRQISVVGVQEQSPWAEDL